MPSHDHTGILDSITELLKTPGLEPDLRVLLAQIHSNILEKGSPPPEKIKSWLSSAWEIVRSKPALRYDYHPLAPLSMLVKNLASLATEDRKEKYHLIFPTLTEFEDAEETEMADLPWGRFIISGTNDCNFVDISGTILKATTGCNPGSRPLLNLCTGEPLSPEECIAATRTSPHYITPMIVLMELRALETEGYEDLEAMQKLRDGLARGDRYGNEGGTEYIASHPANEAIAEFSDYLSNLSTARQSKIKRWTSPSLSNSIRDFGAIWHIITHPNNYLGKNGEQTARTCLNLRGGDIQKIINAKRAQLTPQIIAKQAAKLKAKITTALQSTDQPIGDLTPEHVINYIDNLNSSITIRNFVRHADLLGDQTLQLILELADHSQPNAFGKLLQQAFIHLDPIIIINTVFSRLWHPVELKVAFKLAVRQITDRRALEKCVDYLVQRNKAAYSHIEIDVSTWQLTLLLRHIIEKADQLSSERLNQLVELAYDQDERLWGKLANLAEGLNEGALVCVLANYNKLNNRAKANNFFANFTNKRAYNALLPVAKKHSGWLADVRYSKLLQEAARYIPDLNKECRAILIDCLNLLTPTRCGQLANCNDSEQMPALMKHTKSLTKKDFLKFLDAIPPNSSAIYATIVASINWDNFPYTHICAISNRACNHLAQFQQQTLNQLANNFSKLPAYSRKKLLNQTSRLDKKHLHLIINHYLRHQHRNPPEFFLELSSPAILNAITQHHQMFQRIQSSQHFKAFIHQALKHADDLSIKSLQKILPQLSLCSAQACGQLANQAARISMEPAALDSLLKQVRDFTKKEYLHFRAEIKNEAAYRMMCQRPPVIDALKQEIFLAARAAVRHQEEAHPLTEKTMIMRELYQQLKQNKSPLSCTQDVLTQPLLLQFIFVATQHRSKRSVNKYTRSWQVFQSKLNQNNLTKLVWTGVGQAINPLQLAGRQDENERTIATKKENVYASYGLFHSANTEEMLVINKQATTPTLSYPISTDNLSQKQLCLAFMIQVIQSMGWRAGSIASDKRRQLEQTARELTGLSEDNEPGITQKLNFFIQTTLQRRINKSHAATTHSSRCCTRLLQQHRYNPLRPLCGENTIANLPIVTG